MSGEWPVFNAEKGARYVQYILCFVQMSIVDVNDANGLGSRLIFGRGYWGVAGV